MEERELTDDEQRLVQLLRSGKLYLVVEPAGQAAGGQDDEAGG